MVKRTRFGIRIRMGRGPGEFRRKREFLKLVDDIYNKNKDKFNSPKDVLLLFVKAAFTGRITEIGKLVESSFGKGSFRELGEKTFLEFKPIDAE